MLKYEAKSARLKSHTQRSRARALTVLPWSKVMACLRVPLGAPCRGSSSRVRAARGSIAAAARPTAPSPTKGAVSLVTRGSVVKASFQVPAYASLRPMSHRRSGGSTPSTSRSRASITLRAVGSKPPGRINRQCCSLRILVAAKKASPAYSRGEGGGNHAPQGLMLMAQSRFSISFSRTFSSRISKATSGSKRVFLDDKAGVGAEHKCLRIALHLSCPSERFGSIKARARLEVSNAAKRRRGVMVTGEI